MFAEGDKGQSKIFRLCSISFQNESTPGPRQDCQALTGLRLQTGWGPLLQCISFKHLLQI